MTGHVPTSSHGEDPISLDATIYPLTSGLFFHMPVTSHVSAAWSSPSSARAWIMPTAPGRFPLTPVPLSFTANFIPFVQSTGNCDGVCSSSLFLTIVDTRPFTLTGLFTGLYCHTYLYSFTSHILKPLLPLEYPPLFHLRSTYL